MTTAAPTNISEKVAEARTAIGEEQYLAQSRCIDWLLDCLNAAIRPTVRTIIEDSLSDMAHVNLVTGDAFRASLDEIHLAAQVDAIFDRLELHP
ncbi:MAG: hypothetical protein GY724_11810 [Actinomycetia bacterium]|nr:hypothetical protein [Actinomycetes bacterium]MCP5034799.1 hypothetical protein [Actinomycetes bacterium]